MSNPFQFRDNWYANAPEWLTTDNAEKYMYVLQTCTDILLDKMNQAVKFRMPGQGDPSQLPYLANDRLLVQGPNETNRAFIARLTEAFETWKTAGSRGTILGQLQAYLQGSYPGVAATMPEMAIVGGYYPTVTTWDTVYTGDALGTPPTRATIQPSNFNWDGKSRDWRAWLILYMASVPTGQSGTAGQTSNGFSGSLLGQNVSGVWVPGTSGTPVNTPYIVVDALSGITSHNLGQWIVVSGSANPGNNGTFPITQVNSSTSVTVANPNGVTFDGGPLTWSIISYPFIAPGPPWGQGAYVFGQGQTATPPLDTGSNVGGVWQPTESSAGVGPTISWGLSCSSQVIQSIRLLLKRWKSAATFYPDIIVCFDGGTGVAGNAYSPLSSPGSGNPDGTFGSRGKNVNGVWVPTRFIASNFDAYCQGTGTWNACSVENQT
jgi:hypothetical protein